MVYSYSPEQIADGTESNSSLTIRSAFFLQTTEKSQKKQSVNKCNLINFWSM